MPCALCGTQGHNRRTCQQWQVLEASRQEEAISHTEQILHTPTNSVTDIRFNITYSTTDTNTIHDYGNAFATHIVQRHPISPIPFPDMGSNFTSTPLLPDSDYIPFGDSLFGDGDSDDSMPGLEPIKKNNTPLIDCVEKPCQTDDCPICMEDLKQTDLLVTRCGHQFHGTCMIRHMRLHDNCPMCRGVLFTEAITN